MFGQDLVFARLQNKSTNDTGTLCEQETYVLLQHDPPALDLLVVPAYVLWESYHMCADEQGSDGYTISRRDVAHFISEHVLAEWDRWEGKRVSLSYQ